MGRGERSRKGGNCCLVDSEVVADRREVADVALHLHRGRHAQHIAAGHGIENADRLNDTGIFTAHAIKRARVHAVLEQLLEAHFDLLGIDAGTWR